MLISYYKLKWPGDITMFYLKSIVGGKTVPSGLEMWVEGTWSLYFAGYLWLSGSLFYKNKFVMYVEQNNYIRYVKLSEDILC